MVFAGLEVEHALGACAGPAARLLDHHGHRRHLVEEAQLALGLGRIPHVSGVHEETAVEERAVDVGDHGARVAERIRATGGLVGRAQVFDERALSRMPRRDVAFVDAVDLALLRDADVRVRQEKLAGGAVHGEAVGAVARRVHERGRGPVHDVACRDLLASGPERRRSRRIPSAARTQREDGADRPVDVEVGRAVHGVAGDHEAGRALALAHLDGLRGFLGDERRARPAFP